MWRTRGVFTRIRKDFRRLNCSSIQAMLNQTASNDSKGESFPLDFNLKDVTYAIEVEVHIKRACKLKLLTFCWSTDLLTASAQLQLVTCGLMCFIHVHCSCAILVFLRTETKKSLKRLLCSNFKSQKELLLVTCRYWALFFYTENHFYFLGHVFLKYRRSSCIWFRLISNLISNALLFLII